MRRFALLASLSIFCTTAMACLERPTPITLAGSSLENESFTVASYGLRIGDIFDRNSTSVLLSYSQKKGKWCLSGWGAADPCDLRQQLFITDPKQNNAIIGVINVDNESRQLTIKQAEAPFRPNGFTIKESGAYIVVTDKSDPIDDQGLFGHSILETVAYKPNEFGRPTKLGVVRSSRGRGAATVKSAPISAGLFAKDVKRNTSAVNLVEGAYYEAGCGLVKKEEETERFIIGH